MSFKKKFYKNVAVVGGFSILSTIISFLSTIITSRLLTPEEYGFVAMIMVFISFANLFSDAGISFSIIRSDYHYTFQRAISNLSFYIGIVLFILLSALSYPIALFYGDMKFILPTIIAASTFIFKSQAIIPYAILSKELKFNYIGMVTFLSTLFSISLTIIMAAFGFSYWAIILPQVLMVIFSATLLNIKAKFWFRFYPLVYVKAGFIRSKKLLWNLSAFNFINYWSRNADNLIVGKFFGKYEIGIYGRAYKMLTYPLTLFQSLFGNVMLPSLKRLQQEKGDVQREFLNILGVISIINLPIAGVFLLIPSTFVKILWGNKWVDVGNLLPIIGILVLLQTLNSVTGHLYLLFNHEKYLFRTGLYSSIVSVSSILAGAFFSPWHILFFYSMSVAFFGLPLNFYYGFYKSFGYRIDQILKFWGPKIFLVSLMLCGIWLKINYIIYIGFSLWTLNIIIEQRNEFGKLFTILKSKLS